MAQTFEDKRIQEDEIDLRELFKTIFAYKKFILIFTIVVTISGAVYAFTKKELKEYEGKDLYEIGTYVSRDGDVSPLFNVYNLKEIVEGKFNIKVNIPRNTNGILYMSIIKSDKDEIKTISKEIKQYILNQHSKKVNFLNKQNLETSKTLVVSSKIIDITKKTKKKLIIIVSFITSLILSIFLIFLFEFIKSFKEEEKITNE